ncbi:MAG: hypothetical protein FWG39_03360 [Alphaproteobacteria bacterium]|nr:hypothetical protein [Alphaproteobacteria bacterium]
MKYFWNISLLVLFALGHAHAFGSKTPCEELLSKEIDSYMDVNEAYLNTLNDDDLIAIISKHILGLKTNGLCKEAATYTFIIYGGGNEDIEFSIVFDQCPKRSMIDRDLKRLLDCKTKNSTKCSLEGNYKDAISLLLNCKRNSIALEECEIAQTIKIEAQN